MKQKLNLFKLSWNFSGKSDFVKINLNFETHTKFKIDIYIRRHGKAELMEDNKSLLRKVTVLESLNEPGTSNICAKCLQEIVEPHALIERFRLTFTKIFTLNF